LTPPWALLAAATALAAADIVFSLVLRLVNPAAAWMPWQARLFTATLLASWLLTALAGLGYARRRRRKP
jgi:hypothetical protein